MTVGMAVGLVHLNADAFQKLWDIGQWIVFADEVCHPPPSDVSWLNHVPLRSTDRDPLLP